MGAMFDSLFGSARLIAVGAVALVLGVIALMSLLSAFRIRRQSSAMRQWPSVTGRILSASTRMGRRSSRGGYAYYPAVVYEYQVNGQRFTGSTIRIGSQIGYGSEAMVARNTAVRYPVGQTLPVYYNPENPQEAVLEHGGNYGANLLVTAILIGVIVVTLVSFGVVRF